MRSRGQCVSPSFFGWGAPNTGTLFWRSLEAGGCSFGGGADYAKMHGEATSAICQAQAGNNATASFSGMYQDEPQWNVKLTKYFAHIVMQALSKADFNPRWREKVETFDKKMPHEARLR